MIGKWTYNVADNERWDAVEEFDTKEEAIEAGRRYFTSPDGYLDETGEEYEPYVFDVGLISEPDIKVRAWNVIDQVTENVYEESGEFAEGWLDKVNKEDEKLLSELLTDAFKTWLTQTNHAPKFYVIKNSQSIEIEE